MEDVKSESAATSVIRSAKSSDLIRIAKSSRPESVRAHFKRNAVGGSVRGENPPRFQGGPRKIADFVGLSFDRVHKQTNPGFCPVFPTLQTFKV